MYHTSIVLTGRNSSLWDVLSEQAVWISVQLIYNCCEETTYVLTMRNLQKTHTCVRAWIDRLLGVVDKSQYNNNNNNNNNNSNNNNNNNNNKCFMNMDIPTVCWRWGEESLTYIALQQTQPRLW